jgi:hypothetical protein
MRKQRIRLASPLVAVILVGAATACGGGPASTASATSASSVSCTNYALHGTGKYHDEVAVRVSVSNTTSAAGHYVIDVDLTGSDPAGAPAPDTHVTITGLIPAGSSAVLSRKVLATSQVQHCQITRLTRS